MFNTIKKAIARKAITNFTNELIKEIDTKVDVYSNKRDKANENYNNIMSAYYKGNIYALNDFVFTIIRVKENFKYE